MMKLKNSISYAAVLSLSVFACACSSGGDKENKSDPDKVVTCYRAIDKLDTVLLKVEVNGSLFTGQMEMHYFEKPVDSGELKGQVKGDTLLGEFHHKPGVADQWYRNPVAFLKRQDSVIMGVGELETAWGKAYFRKGVPIDYEQGRFVFKTIPCEEKTTAKK